MVLCCAHWKARFSAQLHAPSKFPHPFHFLVLSVKRVYFCDEFSALGSRGQACYLQTARILQGSLLVPILGGLLNWCSDFQILREVQDLLTKELGHSSNHHPLADISVAASALGEKRLSLVWLDGVAQKVSIVNRCASPITASAQAFQDTGSCGCSRRPFLDHSW